MEALQDVEQSESLEELKAKVQKLSKENSESKKNESALEIIISLYEQEIRKLKEECAKLQLEIDEHKMVGHGTYSKVHIKELEIENPNKPLRTEDTEKLICELESKNLQLML